MAENQNIEYKQTWRDEWLKWLCGFANSSGGTLLVGVDDHGEVVGLEDSARLMEDIPNKIVSTLGIIPTVQLKEEDGKEYMEITVEASPVPIAYKGVYHIRSGSTKQELKGGPALQQFLFSKMGLSWDDVVHPYAELRDLDPVAIEYFLKASKANGRMNAGAFTEESTVTLNNLNLIDEKGRLKNAAILLFGKNPSRFFPLCDFRIGRFGEKEHDLLFQDVVEGDLIRMADRVLDVLRSKYLISNIQYQGIQRMETLEIPEAALREAVFNAIVHRDYTGAHIQMRVYDDRVELWNDGSLPEGWSAETLLAPHYSKPRNPNIASAFYKAGFIESWGRGISKIVDSLEEAGMTAPVFEQFLGGVRVTLFRRPKAEAPAPMNNASEGLQEKVCALLENNPWISIAAISAELGISIYSVRKTINELKEQGRVSHAGGKRRGQWILKQGL